jgi:hypothetical protein
VPKADELRFGVGSTSGPQSSVWTLWVNEGKSDVYVGAEVVVGIQKLSFHQTGEFRFGYTKEWARAHDVTGTPSGGRLWEKWDRPPPAPDGFTKVFYIMVPGSELRVPAERLKDGSVEWVDPPPPGLWVQMTMWFRPTARGPRWILDPNMGYQRVVGELPLPSGETFSVLAAHWPVDPQADATLEAAKRAQVARMGVRLSSHSDPRGVLYRRDDDGTRYFVEFALPPFGGRP